MPHIAAVPQLSPQDREAEFPPPGDLATRAVKYLVPSSAKPTAAAALRLRPANGLPELAASATAGRNPNHHLWRNGRLWWIAFTVVHQGWLKERVRHSLGTDDLNEARRRRDALLALYAPPVAAHKEARN